MSPLPRLAPFPTFLPPVATLLGVADWKYNSAAPGRVPASEFIAALLANQPIEASNVVVEGDFNVLGVEYSPALVFHACTFTGAVDLSEAKFARLADFSQCRFTKSVSLREADFASRLVFDAAVFEDTNAEDEKLDLRRVHVERDFLARGLHCAREIDLEYAKLSSSLDLSSQPERRTELHGRLNLRAAKISGELKMLGIVLKGELRLLDAEVDGYVLLSCRQPWRPTVEGDIWLSFATIKGKLILEGLQLLGDFLGNGLKLEGELWAPFSGKDRLMVQGVVQLIEAEIAGGINLEGARIDGDLNLGYSALHSLRLGMGGKRTRIGGSVILFGATVTREVFIVGTLIGNALLAGNSSLGTLVCDASGFRRTMIRRGAILNGMKASGDVGFRGAKIGGDLSLDKAAITGGLFCSSFPNGRRTLIAGNLSLSGTVFGNSVDLSGAGIAGMLYMLRTEVNGDFGCMNAGIWRTEFGAHALMAGSKITGAALFRGTKLVGGIHLGWSQLRDVGCDSEAEILGGINLERTRAEEIALDGRCYSGMLNLALAKINRLKLLERLPQETDLSGCDVQNFILPGNDFCQLAGFTKPFRFGSYMALEKWLRDRGEDTMADQVFLDMRRRHRREALGWWRRLGDWFLDFTVRYGIASYRLIVYLAVALTFSIWLFARAGALQHEPPGTDTATFHEAVWTSVQTIFPMFAIPAAKGWRPTHLPLLIGGHSLGITYDGYASVLSLLSWIVVPLFVASITGLLKKKPG